MKKLNKCFDYGIGYRDAVAKARERVIKAAKRWHTWFDNDDPKHDKSLNRAVVALLKLEGKK